MHNPPIIPADTSPASWKALCEAVRRTTPEQRIANWEVFNHAMAEMQSASIRRSRPSLTEFEVHIESIRRNHGVELARIASEMLATKAR